MHYLKKVILAFSVIVAFVSNGISQQASPPASHREKIIGMYIHQHWSYNYPYCARTWKLEDWKGYLDGLHRLGYNTVLIWPMLETIPQPMTPSDRANLDKIASVIDMAHHEFNMRALVVLCPNVEANDKKARRYTFEQRPFYHTDSMVDPGDPVAYGKLMAWREKLFEPLKQADGVFIIDSDPGGYPNSTALEFVYILGAHRRMLDHLRKGITIYYWAHFGWESYCKFYATGDLKLGSDDEIRSTISLLAKQHDEPWGVASGRGAAIADAIHMSDRVLTFPYGAVEGEPSFPFTIFGTQNAYNGGKSGGARGVMANAQTHCIQLPNTFAFARGAQGLSITKEDYIRFADDLIPGQGAHIVEGWEALQGNDPKRMDAIAKYLSSLSGKKLKAGPLKGLLFGDPARFIHDLVLQLSMASALYKFQAAVYNPKHKMRMIRQTMSSFIHAAEAWQQTTGYTNSWLWQPMDETLRRLNAAPINAVLATHTWSSEEGATPFDKVKNGLARMESYTTRLIAAMKEALAQMNAG